MGNFLALLPLQPGAATHLFHAGLEAARSLKDQEPHDTLNTSWAVAATFPRQNRSASSIARDSETGSWLLTAGTWFHSAGLGLGEEPQLLKRYLETGANELACELEGFFNIVIGDGRSQEIIVITDVAGSCHCFMRALPHGLAFAGSSLLLAALGDFSLDSMACQEFLHTGIIYQDRTFYREVRKLGPATVHRFASGSTTRRQRYWEVSGLQPESLDGPGAAAALWEALTGAASRIAGRYQRPVCDLTGGYDSRVMVSAFLAAAANFATTVSGPPDCSDVLISQGLAQLMHTRHLHFEPAGRSAGEFKSALALTDGECDLVDYAGIAHVHRALSRQFDISINGSYGELARGYWWELLVPATGARQKLDARKLAVARYALTNLPSTLFPPEHRIDIAQHFTRIIEETNQGLLTSTNTLQMDHAYLDMRMQHWQGRIASSTNQLWSCLSPFMFRSILEVMLQTRAHFRKRSLMVRTMLGRFQPQLAEYPLEHGYPAVPATWRNLHRFRPLLSYYLQRLTQRLQSRPSTKHGMGRRLQLWQEEEVRDLLNPDGMQAAVLLSMPGLREFLSQSQQESFAAEEGWQRLLSLEYTLRALKSWRTTPSAS